MKEELITLRSQVKEKEKAISETKKKLNENRIDLDKSLKETVSYYFEMLYIIILKFVLLLTIIHISFL